MMISEKPLSGASGTMAGSSSAEYIRLAKSCGSTGSLVTKTRSIVWVPPVGAMK
jgi:hypothetical protein